MATPDTTVHLSIPVRDLAEARDFYETAFGCSVGRVRADWLDVWFFGMQLTLQLRPDQVRTPGAQGVLHFGVALSDAGAFSDLIARLRAAQVEWLSEPVTHAGTELSGKVGAKLADPSGNVIEIKYYQDESGYRPG